MISIVMPAKNAQPYLEECLESIVKQSFEDWELLVVNDHSTDSTEVVLNDYAKNDERITVLKNKGNGIIPALKYAYENAQGTFITRMDADDIMPLHKLEFMKKQLEEYGEGSIATGNVSYFAKDKTGEGFLQYANWLNGLAKEGTQFDEIFKECVIPSPCWMLYRSDFDAIGGFDSPVYPEDYDLTFRMYAHNLTPIPVSEVLHFWRDHKDRASRNDPNYEDDTFTNIKVHYFLKLKHQKEKQIQIWGSGRRGKKLARALQKNDIPFKWYCINPSKVGKHIYNVLIEDFSAITFAKGVQVLITFTKNNITSADELRTLPIGEILNEDYFFFA